MKKLFLFCLTLFTCLQTVLAGEVLDVCFDTHYYRTEGFRVPWGYAEIDGSWFKRMFPPYVGSEISRGLDFSQINAVEVPDNSAIDFGSTASFTVSAWVKTTDTKSINTIIDKRDGSGGYHMVLYSGRLLFQLNDGSKHYNFSSTATAKLNDNQWHHVAVTVSRNSSTGIKFYIDSQLVRTFSSAVVPGSISNASPLYIGKHSTSSSYNFNGCIDEVSIYNQALSADQVKWMHNTDLLGSVEDSHWHKAIWSQHRSGKYAKYYTFYLDKTETVEINLKSSQDTYLYLLSGEGMSGSVITYNDDGGDGYNSRIRRTLSAGTYTIEATTYSTSTLGDFNLSLFTEFEYIPGSDIGVTMKHLMYKTGVLSSKWDYNTSFEGYNYLSKNDRNEHVFAVQHWLPNPDSVKNIVFLVAGQQGLSWERQSYPAIVTGQKDDWHRDPGVNWVNTWKYTKDRSYTINHKSLAGQIILDYEQNNGRYFGFSPSDTVLIMLFDACFYVEEAEGNSPIVSGIVNEYVNWILSKCNNNASGKLENIYLAGASRGGSLVTQMAYQMRHSSSYKSKVASSKIMVSCFDGVANHEEGELWANSSRVDNPLEWINTRFAYRSYMPSYFTNRTNTHILQIGGGADVFTGTPWHCFYFDDVPGFCEYRWVDRSHKDIGRNWHDDTIVEHINWMLQKKNR